MGERFLSAAIYHDDTSPDISIEPALLGIEIVNTITPWIRIEQDMRSQRVGRHNLDYISGDTVRWPRFNADLNIVLTTRRLVSDEDVQSDGRLNYKKLAYKDHLVGLAFSADRVNSKRVALVDISSIKRPEHIVAHELGHLLGIKGPIDDNLHCDSKRCLMSPMQFPYGKADRTFCECCREQLHDNSLKLRKAKSGIIAVAKNAKIF